MASRRNVVPYYNAQYEDRSMRRDGKPFDPRWVGVGIAVGAGLGVVFDNLPIGIGIGMMLGVLLGTLRGRFPPR